jgi:hypothetical protein
VVDNNDSGWTSLALDSAGNPHISYYDNANRDLKYANWNGTSWTIETVDSAGDVGRDGSIVVDGSGNPHISYRDSTNGALKYAYHDGSGWNISVVDASGSVAMSSIVLDSSENPHISYFSYVSNGVQYARWDGAAWQISSVESAGGWKTSIALTNENLPRIAYMGYYPNFDVKYASYYSDTWHIDTVEAHGSNYALGTWVSMELDGADIPSIAYCVNPSWPPPCESLRFARWNGSAWERETVDSNGSVGDYASLALDGTGTPHIAYYDATNHRLKHAYRTTIWRVYLPTVLR